MSEPADSVAPRTVAEEADGSIPEGGDGPSPETRRRLIGRASLNLLDQALSALTNVALAFLVARVVTANGFGAFSVAFLVFSILIGLERSLVGQPMSIRFSHVEGEGRRRVVGSAVATVLAITLIAAAGAAMTAAFINGVLGASLLALAVGIPGLILQDTCRMIFFAQGRPHLAVVNDLIWAVLQFGVMAILYATGVDQPWPYLLAWSCAGTVAALVGLVQLGALPRFNQITWWLRSQIDLAGYLFLEFLLGAGSVQGSILLIGMLGSLDDVGSLRAAQTLLGPLAVVSIAIMTFLLPELSRRKHISRRTQFVIAASISIVVVLGSTIYSTALLFIPESLGTALLGSTWTGAESVLLPMSIASIAAGACLGPAIVIYALGQARRTFLLSAFEAPLIVVCMIVGLGSGQTPGAAWGMAISTTVMIPLWCWQLHSVLSEQAKIWESDINSPAATQL